MIQQKTINTNGSMIDESTKITNYIQTSSKFVSQAFVFQSFLFDLKIHRCAFRQFDSSNSNLAINNLAVTEVNELPTEQLINTSWIVGLISKQLIDKRLSKGVLYDFIKTIEMLIKTKSTVLGRSVIKGCRITIKGRLAQKKTALAQKLSLSAGSVSLNSFKEKIAFSQRAIKTKQGIVGLKL